MNRGAIEATARSDAAASSARRRLGVDLTVLVVIGALLVAAVGAAVGALYREFYSPSAFVERYLSLLAEGRAADALALPGVGVDSTSLTEAGLPGTASDALLRSTVLTTLTDVVITGETPRGQITDVTVSYVSGGQAGETTFAVEQAGWIGVAPNWRFARSPLASITLTVAGSQNFAVNGFTLDKRQISPLGIDAPPLEPVSMLVFSPGLYRVTVDTALATAPAVDVLADAPLTDVPLQVQTQATAAFTTAVQEEVDGFLDACAQQQVLNPTGCPFGFTVYNRIIDLPTWSISHYPQVTLTPDGADWRVPETGASAHIDVEVQSLFDGKVREVSEDVPFAIEAQVVILADGSASIRVAAVAGEEP